jgi:hypothetical protein
MFALVTSRAPVHVASGRQRCQGDQDRQGEENREAGHRERERSAMPEPREALSDLGGQDVGLAAVELHLSQILLRILRPLAETTA